MLHILTSVGFQNSGGEGFEDATADFVAIAAVVASAFQLIPDAKNRVDLVSSPSSIDD